MPLERCKGLIPRPVDRFKLRHLQTAEDVKVKTRTGAFCTCDQPPHDSYPTESRVPTSDPGRCCYHLRLYDCRVPRLQKGRDGYLHRRRQKQRSSIDRLAKCYLPSCSLLSYVCSRPRMPAGIDIPSIVLSLDVMDVSGELQRDVTHQILKVRLDQSGNHIPDSHSADPRNDLDRLNEQRSSDYCGSCYGGLPTKTNGCCNTCDDVRQAYINRGWSFNSPESIAQVGTFSRKRSPERPRLIGRGSV